MKKKNVASMKAEMEEKDDRYKRIMAEFENYKKRSAKERETLYESIISEIVSSFLPVLDNLEKAVAAETKDEEYKKGVELMGKDEPYYLGYCPIESNNTMLICIVKKAAVDNVLKEYQKTIGLTTMLMTGFILLLFAGLFYSISRFSIANQKVKFEKRNNELQAMAISEMEEAKKKI